MSKEKKYLDLHLHLDGAITVEIAKKLAEIQHMVLPAEDDAALEKLLTVPADCTSLNDFLKCFALPDSLMQTREGLCEAVRLVAENARSQGVIYAEIRFAPQLHTEKGMSQEEAVLAALDGLKLARDDRKPVSEDLKTASGCPEKSDLKVNLILCCMRGADNQKENLETVELAKKYLVEDGGVVALDLAGAEALFPTSDYRDLFAKAGEYKIPFTIHAGEAAGPESIRAAIEYGAARIGHGVRLYEDPELEQAVKEKGIFLEMCPTSNRQTHAVADMSSYPLIRYLEEGIKVTLNTDDPAIEGTSLADEFSYMERKFGLTSEQEQKILGNAIEAAFTSPEVKEWLRQEVK